MESGGSWIFNGEQRVRPYENQSLNCPRCDSVNTKFCYFNNYNLSQPRHFCKNCRRYWTKGGILRNVPVGGRCRKTKRSKPDLNKKIKSTSRSSTSSDNSSPTNTVTETEVVHGLLNYTDSQLFVSQTAITNPNFESNGGIIPEYGSLMTVPNQAILGLQQPKQEIQLQEHKMTNMVDELKMQEFRVQCLDQTVPVDLAGSELTALDWNSSEDQGWFVNDLPSIDDQGYWSQSQWTDNDHPFYFL